MPAVVVLLVEKDEPLLRSEKMLYEAKGYDVLVADTRFKAEQLLGSQLMDLVVLATAFHKKTVKF